MLELLRLLALQTGGYMFGFDVSTMMHGFESVISGVVVSHACHRLSRVELASMLHFRIKQQVFEYISGAACFSVAAQVSLLTADWPASVSAVGAVRSIDGRFALLPYLALINAGLHHFACASSRHVG
jgi:hypothetical protein